MPLIAQEGKVYFHDLDDNSKKLVASTEAEFINRGYAGAYGTTWNQLTGGSSSPTRPASTLTMSTDDFGDLNLQNGGNAGAGQPITGGNTIVGDAKIGETDAAAESTASVAGATDSTPSSSNNLQNLVGTPDTSEILNTVSKFRDGEIEEIIKQYEQDLQKDIPLPVISVNGVRTELVQGVDDNQNSGWGYYAPDPDFAGSVMFVITQESARAGLIYEQQQADLLRKETFITNYRRAQDDDARQRAANEELARLQSELRITEGQKDAANAINAIQEQRIQSQILQNDAQAFSKEQRIAGETFATGERVASQEFQQGESQLARDFAEEQRIASQDFATQERLGSEAFATQSREDAQTFADEQRIASETFATSERTAAQAFQSAEALLGRQFTTSEREAAQLFAEQMQKAQFAENEASQQRQQDFQEQQAAEARAAELERQKIQNDFQATQAELNRAQQAALESARLGIADATSEEGIAEAVRQAEEARRLERAQTIVRLVQDLSNDPAVVRGLRQSGILQTMGDELGVDFSFLTGGGGLATGSTGTPIRITA
ncbi:MAG: hypothetical protein VW683_05295 [Betaproteobacteria bacterium]